MNVAINGYGRIGRVIHRIISKREGLKLVAINDINPDINNLAYLANYDSTYGAIEDKFHSKKDFLVNSSEKIKVYCQEDIESVSWEDMDIDVLIDSSGITKNLNGCRKLKGKLDKIIVTNSPDENLVDKTVAYGVNEKIIDLKQDFLISSSICDAIAFTPLAKLINDNFGIIQGSLTTLHPWLGYQNLLDGPSKAYSAPGEIHDEYVLGRSGLNLIPKNTSAISATYKILPELKEKFLSVSYRVPTMIVSSADACFLLEKKPSLSEITNLFLEAENKNNNFISNNKEALVSSDLIKNSSSVILDHRFLNLKGNFLKTMSWYDNEWGYSSRVVDLVSFIGKV